VAAPQPFFMKPPPMPPTFTMPPMPPSVTAKPSEAEGGAPPDSTMATVSFIIRDDGLLEIDTSPFGSSVVCETCQFEDPSSVVVINVTEEELKLACYNPSDVIRAVTSQKSSLAAKLGRRCTAIALHGKASNNSLAADVQVYNPHSRQYELLQGGTVYLWVDSSFEALGSLPPLLDTDEAHHAAEEDGGRGEEGAEEEEAGGLPCPAPQSWDGNSAIARSPPEPTPVEPAASPPAAPVVVAAPPNRPPFDGAISEVFTPYLELYTETEHKQMQQQLDKALAVPDALRLVNEVTKVLHGAHDLFRSMAESMKRCISLRRIPLLGTLYQQVFRESLLRYGGFLTSCLPHAKTAGLPTSCHLVNTSAHCLKAAQQLEDALCKALEDPSRAAPSWNIFLEAQHQASVSTTSVSVAKLRPIFSKVRAIGSGGRMSADGEAEAEHNLGRVGDGFAGGCSKYVNEAAEAISGGDGIATNLKANLDKEVYGIILAMFSEAVVQLYLDEIMSCRKLTPPDIRLLLNDAATVQVLLMEMSAQQSAQGGCSESEAGQLSAVEAITISAMRRLIGTLETMQRPPDDMVFAYPELVGGSPQDFSAMLATLDGVDRRQREALVNRLQQHLDGTGGAGPQMQASLGSAALSQLEPVRKSLTGLNLRAKLVGAGEKMRTKLADAGEKMSRKAGS